MSRHSLNLSREGIGEPQLLESQNYRKGEVRRDLWKLSSPPLLGVGLAGSAITRQSACLVEF